MPGKVHLIVTEGPIRGQQFTFEAQDVFLFGRAADCHGRLPEQDRTASRHHFILEVDPPHARLRDLGSLGGTYVNGVRYGGRAASAVSPGGAPAAPAAPAAGTQVDLRHGDEIRAGQNVLRVVVQQAPPAAPPPATPHAPTESDAPLPRLIRDLLGAGRRGEARPAPDGAPPQGQALRPQAPQGQAPAGPALQAPSAQQIAGYAVERLLGRGSVGAVYLVRDQQTGEHVALKILAATSAYDERAQRRFMREIQVARSLHHPNVVALRDSGASGQFLYFTMEYCAGGSLETLRAQRGGALPLGEAAPIMLQALDGLAAAHQAGFVHRDVKPENFLVAGPPGRPVVKLGDLGLAKSVSDAGLGGMTATGAFGGTLPFMAPEQLSHFRDVRPVSDVWAVGATFYVLLTGRYPRQAPTGQTLDSVRLVLEGECVPIRTVERGLPGRAADVIDQALQRDPTARFQDAAEMRRALAAALV